MSRLVSGPNSMGLPNIGRVPGVEVDQAASTKSPGADFASIATLEARIQELEAEVRTLRSDRERWIGIQQELVSVLACKSPDRIMHDLRNALNERELFRSLANLED